MEDQKKPVNGTKQISQKQIDSSARMTILQKHLSDAIKAAHDEIGVDFSVLEVTFTLNEFAKSYSLHGLKEEWK